MQFHPSYAYEDFFEGFRPVSADGGSVGFTLTAGPLRKVASEARANPGEPYVLIVDEINRANLAKVFGELYFLLEYRGPSIALQYSPGEAFTLPPNVFFIGTMNTADRSIALVDAAIRRRFAFVELHPDDPPVRDVLAKWLAASHKDRDERAGLLRALNKAIDEEDRDFKIGPSYLMRPRGREPLLAWNAYGGMTCCPFWKSTTTVGSLAHRCMPGSGWTEPAAPRQAHGRRGASGRQPLQSHPSRDGAGARRPCRNWTGWARSVAWMTIRPRCVAATRLVEVQPER